MDRDDRRRDAVHVLDAVSGHRGPPWDDDGLIDHFEYAVDIPESVPLDVINDPEDTSVSWTPVATNEMWFTFSTTKPETTWTPGGATVLPVDTGDHCLYVRSVDDEGLPSEVAFECFTVQNVHPKTQIEPDVCGSPLILKAGRRLLLRWSGIDPDGSDPEKRPDHFDWTLIPVSSVLILPAQDLTAYVIGGAWTRAEGDTVLLELSPPRGYIAAVRAVDENGGTESRFLRGVNALVLQSLSSNPDAPVLTVRSTLGTHVFPGDGPLASWEIPAGIAFRADLAADTSPACIGGEATFDWGVDVENVEDDPAFHGWSSTPSAGPAAFPAPGLHNVIVKAKDRLGGVVTGTILLEVIEAPFDREVLYVDDYRLSRQGSVSDVMMDDRVAAMLAAAGVPESEQFRFDAWGDADLGQNPAVPSLTEMLRYRVLLWSEFTGGGIQATNALVQSVTCSRNIQTYVAAGGGVWIYGDQVWGSFKWFGSGTCKAQLGYDESSGLFFDASSFPCEFMKICGGDIRFVKATSMLNKNGLLRAIPTPGAATELFPPVEVDSTVFYLAGIPYVDAMFSPTFADGPLDTLYMMRSVATSSPFNNKPIAFRYFDTDPVPGHGPVAVFGFSYHQLKQGSGVGHTGVQGLARSMMDWFRSHARPS